MAQTSASYLHLLGKPQAPFVIPLAATGASVAVQTLFAHSEGATKEGPAPVAVAVRAVDATPCHKVCAFVPLASAFCSEATCD